MSDRNDHGISLVEDAMRKQNKAGAGNTALMMLMVMVLAVSLAVVLGYLVDSSRAQKSDGRSSSQGQQGFDRQISDNAQKLPLASEMGGADCRILGALIGQL